MTNCFKNPLAAIAITFFSSSVAISAHAGIDDIFGTGDTEAGKGGTEIDVVQCREKVGTAALNEPQYPTYHQLDLPNPEQLVKVMIQKSRCFGLVNRGAAVSTMKSERAFADDGELQKGSRMGGGQIKAADYVIVPNIVHKDKNSGGNTGLGGLGGMIGGTIGAVVGGFKTSTREAQVTLEVVNMRTSESFIVEGSATKKDLDAGIGGLLGSVAGGFGGYEDTDLGKVVAVAFTDAYNKLVVDLGGIEAGSAASADNAGYVVSANVKLRGGPTTKAPELGMLYEGTSIIKTGVENGEWVEIEAIGKTGWIKSMYITR